MLYLLREVIIYVAQKVASKHFMHEDSRSYLKNVLIATEVANTYFICTCRVHIYAGNGSAVSLQILNPTCEAVGPS